VGKVYLGYEVVNYAAHSFPLVGDGFRVPTLPLAAVLPPFSCRLQFPISVGLNILLKPGEHVLRRDVADGAVQTHIVVMLDVIPHQTPGIFKR
jgi:hypothetical protein